MKDRCFNKRCHAYKNYGGRGITVCDEWKNDFIAFRDWALSNGFADNLTLDREDVDQGYSPSNCRWLGNYEQQSNKRNNHLVNFKGQTMTLAQLSREIKMPYAKLHKLLKSNPEFLDKAV
jgi:hypothetical protein